MAQDIVTLDGGEGEGGGQILRTALSLSLITGKALRIVNIRAKRPNPGLRAQHLECVQAAQEISNAEVQGAALGSKEISFFPKTLSPGNYQFKIETAGATSLLFQTILVPLSFSEGESTLTLQGGTHALWAPTFDYLSDHFRHFLARIGFSFDLTLERAGFYPEGGGTVHAKIRPRGTLQPLILSERGELSASGGLEIASSVANLPVSIAERQNRKAQEVLSKEGYRPALSVRELSACGKGTHIAIVARFQQGGCCYTALGERGKLAEKVAEEAAQKFIKFVKSAATVDRYLSDQLMLPLSVVGSASEYSTECITDHILTNAKTIKAFLSVEIDVKGEKGASGTIVIASSPSSMRA
jgi:RNA 3'-terminal phosphate cyclase (ATP)